MFDKVGLSSDEACYIVIGDSCAKGYDPWGQKWNISIPGDKPPVTHQAPKVVCVCVLCTVCAFL